MADDVTTESRPVLPEGVARDLLVALGWAAFVGVGIAIGLALGALGSDVGADTEMILIAAVIAGLGTFVVRVLMVVVRRGFRSATRSPAPRSTPPKPTPADDESEPEEKPAARSSKVPAAKKSSGGAKKSSGGAKKSSGDAKKSTKTSPGGKQKPEPRKRSSGS